MVLKKLVSTSFLNALLALIAGTLLIFFGILTFSHWT